MPHYFRFCLCFGAVVLLASTAPAPAHEDAKCGTASAIRGAAGKPDKTLADCEQPELSRVFVSPSGKFAIHYDVSGANAVATDDANANGVPDYVDSAAYYFDYAYTVETGELGYPPAPTDANGGQSAPYDVFLWDIATIPVRGVVEVYGVAFPCGTNLSGGATTRYKTFIVIDNDFSPADSSGTGKNRRRVYNTFSYNALKITAAHEYHHAIQIGNYGFSTSNLAPYETTSTWIETRLFPEILDYATYLRGFFNNDPDKRYGIGDQSAGYGNVLFYMYLSAKHGDGVIRRMWEHTAQGINIFRSLDNALAERGTDLNAAWCDFMPWAYHTGSRARTGEFFPKAAEYPMLRPPSEEYFSEPSLMRSGVIRAFEMQLIRAIFRKSNPAVSPDTADFLITNPNKDEAFLQTDRWRNVEFILSRGNLPNPLSGTPYSWNATPPELCPRVFFSSGVSTSTADFVYPSPYRPDDGDDALNFPIPADVPFAEKIELSVYSPDWRGVYSGEHSVQTHSDRKVVRWLLDVSALSSGAYIYTLGRKGEVIGVGKFSVVRK